MTRTDSSIDELSRIIQTRRSIKPVDMEPARPIERALLMKLLENANWAPTHGLTEPWRFTAFQNDARRELSEAMQRIYRDTTPASEFREDKLRKMSKNPLLAPVVIVLWMERRGGVKIPEIEEIEATACAAQNFLLSASAAGLAAYWSTPPLVYTKDFSSWLGIEDEARCLGLLYVGWPKPQVQAANSTRGPVEDKVIWR